MTPDTVLASMMRDIIDCHGHLGRYVSQHIPQGGSAESMVTMMDTLGIRTLCISGLLALSPDAERATG